MARETLHLILIISCCFNVSFSQNYTTNQLDTLIQNNNYKFRLNGDFDNVLKSNKKYLQLSRAKKYKDGEVTCLLNIANAFWNIGQNKESLKILDELENDDHVLENEKYLFKIYQEKGQCYGNLKLYDLAISNHKKAVGLLQNSHQIDDESKTTNLVYSTGSIAVYYDGLNQPDSALIYHYKSIKLKPSPLHYLNVANQHLIINSPVDSAKYYIDKAAIMLSKNKYPAQQRSFYNRVYGSYLFKINNKKAAEEHLIEAVKIAKETGRPTAIIACYETLTDFYTKTGNHDMKNSYTAILVRIKDSVENIKTHDRNYALSDIIGEHEEELKQESTTSGRLLLLIVIIVPTAILLLLLYLRNKKRLANKLNELDLKSAENRLLKDQADSLNEEIIEAAKNNDPAFLIKFQGKFPEFYNSLTRKHPNLTKSELLLCAYIRLNFSSKEISNYTFVQHKTIQMQKNRLRKKIDISSDTNLYTYFGSEF